MPVKTRNLTDDEKAAIVSAGRKGVLAKVIATRVGCSRETVYKYLRQAGVKYPSQKRKTEDGFIYSGLYISRAHMDWIASRSQSHGITKSRVIRDAIAEYIDRRK